MGCPRGAVASLRGLVGSSRSAPGPGPVGPSDSSCPIGAGSGSLARVLPPPPNSPQSVTVLPGHKHVLPDSDDDQISTETTKAGALRWPESQLSDGRRGGRKISIVHKPICQGKRSRTDSQLDGGDPPARRANCTALAPTPKAPLAGARARAARCKTPYGRLGLRSGK